MSRRISPLCARNSLRTRSENAGDIRVRRRWTLGRIERYNAGNARAPRNGSLIKLMIIRKKRRPAR